LGGDFIFYFYFLKSVYCGRKNYGEEQVPRNPSGIRLKQVGVLEEQNKCSKLKKKERRRVR
jgi:hypothetical protein